MKNFNIITVDEYFKLLDKDNLTIEEMSQKNAFKKFILDCQEYESLISPAAQSILADYNNKLLSLETKKNKTSHEENVLKEFQNTFQEQESNENKEYSGPTRNLSKAGYMDATIILALLLNVGFIIAMVILGS